MISLMIEKGAGCNRLLWANIGGISRVDAVIIEDLRRQALKDDKPNIH